MLHLSLPASLYSRLIHLSLRVILSIWTHFLGRWASWEICLLGKLLSSFYEECSTEINSIVKLSPLPSWFKANPFPYRAVKYSDDDSLRILRCSCIQISTRNVNHVLHAERRLTEVVGSGVLSTIQSSWLCESVSELWHVLFRTTLANTQKNSRRFEFTRREHIPPQS